VCDDIYQITSIQGLTALSPEIDCDLTAMDLPPITSAVFFIAKNFW
jgi:hypothetical protein